MNDYILLTDNRSGLTMQVPTKVFFDRKQQRHFIKDFKDYLETEKRTAR